MKLKQFNVIIFKGKLIKWMNKSCVYMDIYV